MARPRVPGACDVLQRRDGNFHLTFLGCKHRFDVKTLGLPLQLSEVREEHAESVSEIQRESELGLAQCAASSRNNPSFPQETPSPLPDSQGSAVSMQSSRKWVDSQDATNRMTISCTPESYCIAVGLSHC
jgi:hypothetical protein